MVAKERRTMVKIDDVPIGEGEMLDISTLFFKIWLQTDVSQSYKIMTNFLK
jgi:hypothetical protein